MWPLDNVHLARFLVGNSTNHYDCVNAGYGVAQQTFRNLEELEEFERDYINQNKIVVRFECKQLRSKI